MMKNDADGEIYPWYEVVHTKTHLSQGDIIIDCPIIRWANSGVEVESENIDSRLKSLVESARSDIIVMTQACDLDNCKVSNVMLCPHISLERHRELWEKKLQQQNPTQSQKKIDKT